MNRGSAQAAASNPVLSRMVDNVLDDGSGTFNFSAFFRRKDVRCHSIPHLAQTPISPAMLKTPGASVLAALFGFCGMGKLGNVRTHTESRRFAVYAEAQ